MPELKEYNHQIEADFNASAKELIGCTLEEYEKDFKPHLEAFLKAQKKRYDTEKNKGVLNQQQAISQKLAPFYR